VQTCKQPRLSFEMAVEQINNQSKYTYTRYKEFTNPAISSFE
jgi:hypothetical protein